MANNHTGKQLIEKTMLEDFKKEYEDEKANNNKTKKYPKGMTLLEYVLLTKEKGEQKSYFECLLKNYGKNLFEQNTSLISRIITNRFFQEENINFEVLDLLVENGANVNDPKGEYGPPLLASICFKKEKIFEWLVEREDIDLTAYDEKGNALHKLIGEWNDNTKQRVGRMLENFMQKAHSKGHLHKLQEQKSEKRDLKPCKTDTEKDVLHKKFEDLSKKYEKRDELYKEREIEITDALKKLLNGNVSCPVDECKLKKIISNYCRCPGDVSTCEGKVVYFKKDIANIIKKLCHSMEYDTFIRVFEEEDVFKKFITYIKSIKKVDAKKKTGNVEEIQDEENVKEIKDSHSTISFSNSTIGTVIVNNNQGIQSSSDQLSLTTSTTPTSPTIPTPTTPVPANVPTSGKLPVESTDQTDNPMALFAEEQQSASDPSMKSPEKEFALRQGELETGNRNDEDTDRSTQIGTAQTGNKDMQSISGGGHVPVHQEKNEDEAFTEFQQLLFNDRFRVVILRDGPPQKPWHQDEVWSEVDYLQYDSDNEL